MSRIKEHLVNILNFEEPDYDKKYGEWYQSKLDQLHNTEKVLETMDNQKYSVEYNKLLHKKDAIIEELNNQ